MVQKNSYKVPPIFGMLAKDGGIEEHIMYNTYNMGIGMVLAVDKSQSEQAKAILEEALETVYFIGEVKAGEKGVTLC